MSETISHQLTIYRGDNYVLSLNYSSNENIIVNYSDTDKTFSIEIPRFELTKFIEMIEGKL